MTLFNFFIPESWLLFALWLVYIVFYSKSDKNKAYVAFMWFFGIWLFSILTWATYQRNYAINYNNVAKITVHTCTKDNKSIETDCEYIGLVTYRPFMRELMITTTPLYPILNCPSNICIQEQIFVDKENVKNITALE